MGEHSAESDALVGWPRITVRVMPDRDELTGYWRDSEADALGRYLTERASDPHDNHRYVTAPPTPGDADE